MTLHIVYAIIRQDVSLFQGSQGEILGFAKPITFYVPLLRTTVSCTKLYQRTLDIIFYEIR